HDRDDSPRQAEDAVPALRRRGAHRDARCRRALDLRRDRAGSGAVQVAEHVGAAPGVTDAVAPEAAPTMTNHLAGEAHAQALFLLALVSELSRAHRAQSQGPGLRDRAGAPGAGRRSAILGRVPRTQSAVARAAAGGR